MADMRRRVGAHQEEAEPTASVVKVLKRTLHWDEIEEWQRDNPHIHTGYRSSHNSFGPVFKSLFYVHNETGNIYSHLIPALLIGSILLWCFDQVLPADALYNDQRAFLIFGASAITCLGMSATFHLIKSHSHDVQRTGNKLDYLGICILIAGSMVSLLHFALGDLPRLQYVFTTLLCSVGVCCGCVSLLEMFRTPAWRPYRASMFVIYGLCGALPIVYCGLTMGWSQAAERCALGWMLLSAFGYIFGAFLYGILFPEKWMPGKFDHYGHSHQLFHFLVVFAAWCHYKALCTAFEAAKARST